MSLPDMTVKRVRFKDSDLVIEITYDGLEPVTARAIGNVSGFGSNPDRDRAVAFALTQAITAYKNNSLADRNKKNAKKPRKDRMRNPTPDEVFSAMRDLRYVDRDGEIVVAKFRNQLLEKVRESYPGTTEPQLDKRIGKLRKQNKIR